MFGRICLHSHQVSDFWFLEVFKSHFQFQYWRLVCSHFEYIPGSVMVKTFAQERKPLKKEKTKTNKQTKEGVPIVVQWKQT